MTSPLVGPVSGIEDGTSHIFELDDLKAHLQEVSSQPNAKLLDGSLIERVYLQLNERNVLPVTEVLLSPVADILFRTNQDARPLIALARKLIVPLTFSQLRELAGPDELMIALGSEWPGANLLALEILSSAGRNAAKVAVLRDHPEVTRQMMSLCLNSEDVSVSQTAMRVLRTLLEANHESVRPNGVHHHAANGNDGPADLPFDNVLWRQLFSDEQGLLTILDSCHATSANTAEDMKRITTAQGRLLEFLPQLIHVNPDAISTARFPERYRLTQETSLPGGYGVLQWAALEMIDRTDELMYRQLLDFWRALILRVYIESETSCIRTILSAMMHSAVWHDEGLIEVFRQIPDQAIHLYQAGEVEADAMRQGLSAFIQQLIE
ncbi:hypothetical protein B0T10DRAFT_48178 [Thelonectria olida]|uniref:Uncharacterized protein n=1 Tax=Thelonectria olida TaxID=1576542 RepID=A0A9P9APP1_9HYPO|nr:hypothetical protein B0T10DRAFT_48178 [Thelonectria olida]